MTKATTWFKTGPIARASGSQELVGEIMIFEEIGFFGVTALDFRNAVVALAREVDKVRVRINSGGGSVFDAIAIYHTLKGLSKPVEVVIDGVAASAASFIAMAGDPVIMPENSFIMVHLPQWISVGTSEQMRKDADALDM